MAKLSGGSKRHSSRKHRRSSRRKAPAFGMIRRKSRRSSRRTSSSAFGVKSSLKDAAMFGLIGAGLSYAVVKLGNYKTASGQSVIQKVSAYTQNNTSYAGALLLAGLGLGAGYLLRKRNPKLAKTLCLAGVGLGVVSVVSSKIMPTESVYANTPTSTAGIAGLLNNDPTPDMSGMELEGLDGMSLDNEASGYGNVPVSVGGSGLAF